MWGASQMRLVVVDAAEGGWVKDRSFAAVLDPRLIGNTHDVSVIVSRHGEPAKNVLM